MIHIRVFQQPAVIDGISERKEREIEREGEGETVSLHGKSINYLNH